MTDNQPQPIRQLTPQGVTAAKEYLAALREGRGDTPFPAAILTDVPYSEPVEPAVSIAARDFANRREAGRYLKFWLGYLPASQVIGNAGLWSWLGMFYFDRLVDKDDDGCPNLGRNPDVAYVIDQAAAGRGERRHFAHRLLLAYETYTRHGENAWFMLEQPVNSVGQLADRLIGAPALFRSRGIVKLAHLLYADRATGRTKPGFGGGGRERQRSPGNLMRFIDVMDQLYMTYDVYGMTAEELLKLLPAEFDRWRPGVAESGQDLP